MSRLLISSVQNPRIKDVARLRRREDREAQQRFIIDGAREILRSLQTVALVEVYVCEELFRTEDARQTLQSLEQQNMPRIDVTPKVFEKISYGDRSDGLLAVGKLERMRLDKIMLPEAAFVAIVEGIEKPGNLGAILRSADAAGVTTVIVVDGCTDTFNPNCIRASLGTVFTRPVCEASTAETIAWLVKNHFQIFAARVDGAIEYTAADYRGKIAIVLGSEAHGLTSQWHAKEVQAIRLPMLGVADSLNVSATAAVLFYEALRQRSLPTH
jgi:TrmH family RNA methyltransferase